MRLEPCQPGTEFAVRAGLTARGGPLPEILGVAVCLPSSSFDTFEFGHPSLRARPVPVSRPSGQDNRSSRSRTPSASRACW